tara:strand:+ start:66 stop:635 length:570 start_codon:yes stop_codon:yes gene_type:complete
MDKKTTEKLWGLVQEIELTLLHLAGFNSWEDAADDDWHYMKGKCYTTTIALYQMWDEGGLSLYRKKDYEGIYHWFIIVDECLEDRKNGKFTGDYLIDMTARQYGWAKKDKSPIKDLDTDPSILETCEYMKAPLHYPSYKDKVNNFIKLVGHGVENFEKRRKPINLEDFMDDKPTDTTEENPVTLDDFFD